MAAVSKPKVPPRGPKTLQAREHPERLLGPLAAGDWRGPLELVINHYLSTRKSHLPNGKFTPLLSPLRRAPRRAPPAGEERGT